MGRKNKNKKTSTSPSPSVAGEIQPAKSETKDNSGAASLATKHEEPISSQSGSSTMPPDEPVPDGVARSSRTDTGHDEHSSAPAPAIQTPEHTDIDTSSGTSSDSKNPGSEVSNGGTQSEVAGGEPRARESLATPVHQNDSAAENISGRVDAGTNTNEHNKRIEELENRLRTSEGQLQESEERRKKLQGKVEEIRENWSETLHRYDTLRMNRNKENEKYSDRLKDRDAEEDRLRTRIRLLEDELAQEQRTSPTISESQEIRNLQRALAQAEKREDTLVRDLALERDKSKRLEKQLLDEASAPSTPCRPLDEQQQQHHHQQQQQEEGEGHPDSGPETGPTLALVQAQAEVRVLTAELGRARAALADSERSYWALRSENNRLQLDRHPTAAQFVRHHGARLLDPRSRLHEAVARVAAFRDGGGPPPTEGDRAQLRTFREFLAERAAALREAMELEDPRPRLRAFEDRWGPLETAEEDWGALVALHLSATRAATAIRFSEQGEERAKELETLKEAIAHGRDSMGEDYDAAIGDKVNDLHDELEKMKNPRAKA